MWKIKNTTLIFCLLPLPIANCLLLIAYCLLPIAYCLLPIDHYLVSLHPQFLRMVRKSFGIYSEDHSGCVLFIETGNEYIACWCKHDETKQVRSFELFNFTQADAGDFDKLLRQVQNHSRLLTESFQKVYCIWSDEKCVCIPNEFYRDDVAARYMQTMLGDNIGTTFYKDNLNGYVVLAVLQQQAATAFEGYYTIDANVHKYFQLLKAQHDENTENKIHLVFYPTYFIASAFKEGKLQLIQSFPYKLPEDALYHVTSVCNAFGLSLNDTNVYASGMMDTNSSLYQTLYGHITNFSFEPTDTELFAAEDFHQYPLHYFTSFCQYDV